MFYNNKALTILKGDHGTNHEDWQEEKIVRFTPTSACDAVDVSDRGELKVVAEDLSTKDHCHMAGGP